MESITPRSNNKEVTKILFVGRLDKQKNPLMLLEVAKEVILRYPRTILPL